MSNTGDDTFPWPSSAVRRSPYQPDKATDTSHQKHLLTDALFSAPRLRFTRAQRRAILAWGKKLGAPGVPTLDQLTRTQARILDDVGNPTRRKLSSSGSVFYLNDIGRAIAMVCLLRRGATAIC